MAHKLPNGVHETTNTSDILGAANPIVLNGAQPNRWDFNSQLANLDTTEVRVFDTTSGDWEVMTAVFTAPSTLTPGATRLASSAGGSAIDWPATGTRDVVVSVRGEAVASLLDPAAAAGLVTRTAQDVYAARTLQPDADSRITWTNGGGIAGNPVPVLTGLYSYLASKYLDLTSGAGVSLRTMQGRLVLAASRTALLLTSSKHTLAADDAGADPFLEIEKMGANDFLARLRVGNTWRNLVHESTVGTNHADTADDATAVNGWDPTSDESDWDAGNTRGTLLLPGGFRVNFGLGTLVGTGGPTASRADLTFHTAFGSIAYVAAPVVVGVTTIAGDGETGLSYSMTLSGISIYHANGFTGLPGGYIALGHD